METFLWCVLYLYSYADLQNICVIINCCEKTSTYIYNCSITNHQLQKTNTNIIYPRSKCNSCSYQLSHQPLVCNFDFPLLLCMNKMFTWKKQIPLHCTH